MKKVLLFIAVSLMFIGSLLAQAPQKFTYQAVVRDAYNTLVPSKPIGVKISILQSSLNGPVVYAEEHTTVTNANGLMTLQIGGGALLDGDFASIDWVAGPYFLKCETDPQGGTNYTVTGAQQLLSVPYALYSEKSADAFSGDYNDLSNAPTIPTTTGELVNDAGFITAADIPDSVSYFVNDAGYITKDSIPTNVSAFTNDAGYLTSYTEVQALSISHDTIFLTNGGFVKLPADFDGDYNSLTNKPTIPTNVSSFTNDAGYITKDSIQNTVITVVNNANYITKDSIPTNVSAFTNDAGYLTTSDLQELKDTIIALHTDTIQALHKEIGALMDSIKELQQSLNTLTTLVNTLNVQMEQELFSATAGQTAFTLQHAPKPTCIIRCYVNGVMVGSDRSGLLEIDSDVPQQVNYSAAYNRNYSLKANDKVTIVYWY